MIKKSDKVLGKETLFYDKAEDLLEDFCDYQVRGSLVKEKQAATNKVQLVRVW